MIYFIEHDAAGNICHICADPIATIVPLVNRVTFTNQTGTPLTNTAGADLSPSDSPLAEPVGIDAATYKQILAGGLSAFRYDLPSGKVVAATPTAPSSTTTTTPAAAK